MGLRDDMEALEYWNDRGLGKEYMRGELTPKQLAERTATPLDTTATARQGSQDWWRGRD